eukprot:scaffold19190_cov53-Phaeocystis_antarctica.AAC.4
MPTDVPGPSDKTRQAGAERRRVESERSTHGGGDPSRHPSPWGERAGWARVGLEGEGGRERGAEVQRRPAPQCTAGCVGDARTSRAEGRGGRGG